MFAAAHRRSVDGAPREKANLRPRFFYPPFTAIKTPESAPPHSPAKAAHVVHGRFVVSKELANR